MYTLHGHLGGVLLLATTGLGDTLVSVGIDRVAKVFFHYQAAARTLLYYLVPELTTRWH